MEEVKTLKTTDLRDSEVIGGGDTETQQALEQMHTETPEHTSETHHGPHVPLIQGEKVWGPISNTSITTFVFLLLVIGVSVLANRALKKEGKSRLRTFFLTFIQFFDSYLRESFGDKDFARKHFVLVVGIFMIVFFGNMLGLIIDWLGASISPTVLGYLRPMHSDLNTTVVLAFITIFIMMTVMIKSHGVFATLKSYVFNFSGHNLVEKCVNVFVGWLHFIGIGATLASLSLRLFGNIFAGVVLLGVITYLLALATTSIFEIGRVLSVPFWFFEIGVALIQAIVFAGLIIANLNNAKAEHH